MDIIGDAFAQGIVPGIVIAVVYVVEKIISSRKKDPLVDIAKLLNIVTKDIIEKDREKSKAVVDVALSYGGSEFIKFVNTTIGIEDFAFFSMKSISILTSLSPTLTF